MSLHSVHYNIADSVSNSLRVSGSPMVDMALATLASGLLLQYLPWATQLLLSVSARLFRHLSARLRRSSSDLLYTIELTSSMNGNHAGRSHDDDGYHVQTPVHSPNIHSEHHLPVILGVLHYLQSQGTHLKSSGTFIGHLQPAMSEATTREQLLKAVMCFIPDVPVSFEGMRFTFDCEVSKGGNGEDGNGSDNGDEGGQYRSSSSRARAAAAAAGSVSTIRMTVQGNDLPVIQSFLAARLQDEVDLAYPQPEKEVEQTYLFELDADNHRNGQGLRWFRSHFATTKTFRTVFLEQKALLMDTLQQFESQTGAWAPERERPNKLVILLEGLPGTGKTSSIKAIANLTQRNLLYINAGDLKDDATISRIFRDSAMHFIGDGCWRNEVVPHNRRILIFEDVDCSGAAEWLFDREHRRKTAAITDVIGPIGPLAPSGLGRKKRKADKDNDLDMLSFHTGPTLSGLLNTLDGVCELNGHIVILTTNHANLFDPALLRAGRIDLRISMDWMKPRQCIDMIECAYAGSMSDEQQSRIIEACTASKWTPSDVQQWCQAAGTIDAAVENVCKHRTGSNSSPAPSEVLSSAPASESRT